MEESGTRLTRRILIAEDNKFNRLVTTTMLKKLSIEADTAVNGKEVLDAVERRQDYDLILMDCEMPVMDGYAATAAIRAQEADAAHIPIVAMTAYAMAGDREKCFSAGMDDYISKPVKLDELKTVLEKWLEF